MYMWAFFTSWLTPASLFLFLNLMIGAIALTSRLGSHNQPVPQPPPQTQSQENQQHHFARASSSLLERVRSVNFSLFKFPSLNLGAETTTSGFVQTAPEPAYRAEHADLIRLERAPSLLERVRSINLGSFYRSEPEKQAEPESVTGSGLDPGRGSGHAAGSCSGAEHHAKRSKSESKIAPERKSDAVEETEMSERRRPATTKVDRTVSFGDEGVDAKADDFINRFKQQLKLQRLDSLLRYKELLKGKQKV